MAIKVQASRFALLKVEDDYEKDDSEPKQDNLKGKGANQNCAAKKKNKKKKKIEKTRAENEELRNMAFGPGSAKGRTSQATSHKGVTAEKPPVANQWDEWKKMDSEYTQSMYEKDLQQALLMSKLDSEQVVEEQKLTESSSAGALGSSKDKKRKKKDKPLTMSLDEFNRVNDEPEQAAESNTPKTAKTASPPPVDVDPKFFEKVDHDTSKILQKERIQDEYKKKYIIEGAKELHYREEIEKRDKEIRKLKDSFAVVETELKQVKKRNQQLCHILAQGEMKDKSTVLLELEELKAVRDELMQEVTQSNIELQKERSKVHALKAETDKFKGNKHGAK